ncbi:MAG: dephospho-CoA kinase, partial [Thermodesulfobacteriota bacterium]
IATGKTLVAGELAKLGAAIIDTDLISREVLKKDGPAYPDVVMTFGDGILDLGGEIDRKKLGAIVFADRDKLRHLGELTHPHIRKIMYERIEESRKEDPTKVIVAVVPLLIEVGLNEKMDKVLLVTSTRAVQIERTKARDSLSTEEAEERIASQMPLQEKIGFADFIIDNNGSKEETVNKTRDFYEEIKKEATNE